jgi:O-antigen ligase
MIVAHPLLGVGPDNFRLTYGPYAGLTDPDPRTHSNDMYLEVLTGGGLAAGAAFFWLLWRAGGCLIGDLRRAAAPQGALAIGLVAAGVAIGLHALVDSFLSFGPTYILFSLTLGLAVACARGLETHADAHRV